MHPLFTSHEPQTVDDGRASPVPAVRGDNGGDGGGTDGRNSSARLATPSTLSVKKINGLIYFYVTYHRRARTTNFHEQVFDGQRRCGAAFSSTVRLCVRRRRGFQCGGRGAVVP